MTSNLSQTARPVAISFKDFRDEEIVDFFANENRMFHPEIKPNSFGRSRLIGAPHFSMERKGTAAFRVSFRANGLQQEKCPSRNGILRADPAGTIPVPPDIFAFANETNPQTRTAQKHSLGNHFKKPNQNQIKTIELPFENSSRPLASTLMPVRTERKQAVKIVCDPLESVPLERTRRERRTWEQETKKTVLCSVNTSGTPSGSETESSEKTESTAKQMFGHVRETDAQLDRLIETWPRLSSQLKETITTLLEVSESDGTI
jgi:hypothetical protein